MQHSAAYGQRGFGKVLIALLSPPPLALLQLARLSYRALTLITVFSYLEAARLDAQAGDLTLLEQLLELGEVLDAP
jgi:hypothetical protein